ncbi:hypothetical protein [Saccharopolyspora hordei]|uniref:Uncharacterized protein n=1 Tax=Saccharopolyspora hordei TaxID=1838 RepID=A0A853AQY2_9PSEU|nr:hypothetical protein [Saccharopolyspora hordei]NYI83490.1 hypothetical protein [Saccharopolyspora hordei]
MSDDDVFNRRWVLAEDELLRMLWRCYAGENPDVVLVELHACRRGERRNPGPFNTRTAGAARRRRHRVVH